MFQYILTKNKTEGAATSSMPTFTLFLCPPLIPLLLSSPIKLFCTPFSSNNDNAQSTTCCHLIIQNWSLILNNNITYMMYLLRSERSTASRTSREHHILSHCQLSHHYVLLWYKPYHWLALLHVRCHCSLHIVQLSHQCIHQCRLSTSYMPINILWLYCMLYNKW